MTERLYRITSIGRPIDRRHPTNRAIAALTLGVALVDGLVRVLAGSPPPQAFVGGLVVAAAFFLAWALAREIDPDHDVAAFVAAILSVVASLGLERPDFAAIFLVLLGLRIVNRSVGPAAKPGDTVFILLLVALAAWRGHPVAAAFGCGALLLDGVLSPGHRPHLLAALLALPLVAWGAARGEPAPVSIDGWAALASALPALVLVRESAAPASRSDLAGERLGGSRVRAGQLLALLALVAAILVGGRPALAALSPLWAALAGTGALAVLRATGFRG